MSDSTFVMPKPHIFRSKLLESSRIPGVGLRPELSAFIGLVGLGGREVKVIGRNTKLLPLASVVTQCKGLGGVFAAHFHVEYFVVFVPKRGIGHGKVGI